MKTYYNDRTRRAVAAYLTAGAVVCCVASGAFAQTEPGGASAASGAVKPGTAGVVVNDTPVREKPRVAMAPFGQLHKGERVDVLNVGKWWALIAWGNKQGYVPLDTLAADTPAAGPKLGEGGAAVVPGGIAVPPQSAAEPAPRPAAEPVAAAAPTPAPEKQPAAALAAGDTAVVTGDTPFFDQPKASTKREDGVKSGETVTVLEVGKWWANVSSAAAKGYVPLSKLEAKAAAAPEVIATTTPPPAVAPALNAPPAPGSPVASLNDDGGKAVASNMALQQGLAGESSDLPPPRTKTSNALADGAPRIRVLVYSLVAANLEPEHVALVDQSLTQEIRKLQRVSTIGMDEVRQLLSLQETKQMLGCEGDEGCLAEIGGALGADFLVMGTIGEVGGSSVLQIKRVNMQSAQTLHAFTKRMSGGTGEELLEALGPAVAELFPEYELRPGVKRGVAVETVERWNPPPLRPWAFWTAVGVAGGGAVLAGFFWYQRRSEQTHYQDLLDQSTQAGIAGADLSDQQSRAEKADKIMWIGAGTFALGAAAAGVIYPFVDWDASVRVTPTVTPGGGAAVAVAGSF